MLLKSHTVSLFIFVSVLLSFLNIRRRFGPLCFLVKFEFWISFESALSLFSRMLFEYLKGLLAVDFYDRGVKEHPRGQHWYQFQSCLHVICNQKERLEEKQWMNNNFPRNLQNHCIIFKNRVLKKTPGSWLPESVEVKKFVRSSRWSDFQAYAPSLSRISRTL